MASIPIKTQLNVNNISTVLSMLGTAYENPNMYLWSLFFKVDGSTVKIVVNGTTGGLQGTATVVGTPGDQGDLPGGIQASYYLPETTPVPASLGHYATTLVPFPISGLSGFTMGGMVVGWLGILIFQNDTPGNAVAAGHQALNSAIQHALDNVIPTITASSPMITPADITSAESQVRSQVVDAMKNALSIWDKLATVLNTESQDSYAGMALQYFTDSDLLASPPRGATIKQSITSGGKDDPQLYVFTFNGAAIANWKPYSVRRVLTSLGHAPPVSLRAVMGAGAKPSVLAWIEAVA